jgi:hypothetical protein
MLQHPERWPLKKLLPMKHRDGRSGFILQFSARRVYLGPWDTVGRSTTYEEFATVDDLIADGWECS